MNPNFFDTLGGIYVPRKTIWGEEGFHKIKIVEFSVNISTTTKYEKN